MRAYTRTHVRNIMNYITYTIDIYYLCNRYFSLSKWYKTLVYLENCCTFVVDKSGKAYRW